ncbi:hypothetical protein [Blastococcus sp. SYSU DS0617]
MENPAVCPSCSQVIERQHNGKAGTSEFTDPWEFVEHDRDDLRGNVMTRQWCPGSGKNVTMAAKGY